MPTAVLPLRPAFDGPLQIAQGQGLSVEAIAQRGPEVPQVQLNRVQRVFLQRSERVGLLVLVA